MAHIKIKKGLNIPIEGAPVGSVEPLPPPPFVCLDFSPFQTLQPHLLVSVGDAVVVGQSLIADKQNRNRVWVSPASGVVQEILRGPKRVLEGILIASDGKERQCEMPSEEDPLSFLCQTGLINHFWMRPFHVPAQPHLLPRSIFVKGLESAPFTPSVEMQIAGLEAEFQAGLTFLSRIANTHLVSYKGLGSFQNVNHHTAEGPHPISNPSLHIHLIDPIRKVTDVVWTIDAQGVLSLGYALLRRQFLTHRIISLSGMGFHSDQRKYYRSSLGIPLDFKTSGKLISGDPLMGQERSYLGFFHSVCTSLPESSERESLHFLRFGGNLFTATKTYLCPKKLYPFTTLLHGEERAFIDGGIYEKVMPLKVPVVPLVKAVLGEDFEKAEELGLLEIAPEDFALPTFICPSKIEMVEIIEKGLKRHAAESLSVLTH